VAQGGLDQRGGLGGIVVKVAVGQAHRLADLDVAREMDDRARPVADKHLVEPGAVADVTALQRPPPHRPSMAFLEGVVADRGETRLGERLADMAADIACTAGDQHGGAHRLAPAPVCCTIGLLRISHPSIPGTVPSSVI
jgi:hypothetical protein